MTARPDLNGQRGRVLGTDATGRIMVRLASEAVRVKEENLQEAPAKAQAPAAADAWYGAATASEPTAALRFLIESARLRVEDVYVQCGDAVGAYAEGAGEVGEAARWLLRYVRAAAARDVLPRWWNDDTTAALFNAAKSRATVTMNGKQHGFNIGHAVEEFDVAAVWGMSGVARLRALAETILGPVHAPFTEDEDAYDNFSSDDEDDDDDDEDDSEDASGGEICVEE